MGYVAGVGRGATGFTKQSDLGLANYASENKYSPPDEKKKKIEDDSDYDSLNDCDYDEFSGYSGSLFSNCQHCQPCHYLEYLCHLGSIRRQNCA